jgi:hypothetical protein
VILGELRTASLTVAADVSVRRANSSKTGAAHRSGRCLLKGSNEPDGASDKRR